MKYSLCLDCNKKEAINLYIDNNTEITNVIKSKVIAYFSLGCIDNNYYYIFYCDGNPTKYKVSDYIYNFLNIINLLYASDSGIYLIIKYDKVTHDIVNIEDNIDNLIHNIYKPLEVIF